MRTGQVGRHPSSSPAHSPLPHPTPSFCGLSHSKLSLCRTAHFPPGDTGDHIPGLLLLHKLDVTQESSEDQGIMGLLGRRARVSERSRGGLSGL